MIDRGLLMPAYASQYVGMGKGLYDEFRVIQEYFEEASDCVSVNFVKLAFASSDIDVHSFEQGPLLLFLIEAASAALLRTHHVPFHAASGMDMPSWYSALHAAQALTLPDGLYLIKKWTEFAVSAIEQKSLMTLTLDRATVELIAMLTALCEQSCERGFLVRLVTVTPHSIRITGVPEGVAYLTEQLEQQQVLFHHAETQDILDTILSPENKEIFMQYFEKIDIKEPEIPIVHPLQAGYATTNGDLQACARDLLVKPVRNDLIMRTLAEWTEGIIAVPSLHSKEQLSTELSSIHWYTMETVAECQQLIEHTQPEAANLTENVTTEEEK